MAPPHSQAIARLEQVERDAKESAAEAARRVEEAQRRADGLRDKVEAAMIISQRNSKLDADLTR